MKRLLLWGAFLVALAAIFASINNQSIPDTIKSWFDPNARVTISASLSPGQCWTSGLEQVASKPVGCDSPLAVWQVTELAASPDLCPVDAYDNQKHYFENAGLIGCIKRLL